MEQLKALEHGLVDAMEAKQKAVDAADKAEQAYDKALELIMENNAEFEKLFHEHHSAKEASKKAKAAYVEAKSSAVKDFLELTDPEDIKEVEGCSYRREKMVKWLWNENERIRALVKNNAILFLKVDEKAVSSFVKNNAVEVDGVFQMPEHIKNWLYGLRVETIIKPTVSDAKLAKLAIKK